MVDICSKDPASGYVINLSPHQMDDGRRDILYSPAIPFFYRADRQQIIVFMISIHPERGERLFVQPFPPPQLLPIFRPITKIAADDYVVALSHRILLREYLRAEPAVVPVAISRNVNRHGVSFIFSSYYTSRIHICIESAV